MRLLLVVAAALIDTTGRVLITQRPAGKAMAGLWEFPGGKVEPGETPEAALVRELQEEIGVDVPLDALVPMTFASHTYDTFHLLMPLYEVRTWSGTPVPREVAAVQFVATKDLNDFAMPAADAPLVAAIQQRFTHAPFP